MALEGFMVAIRSRRTIGQSPSAFTHHLRLSVNQECAMLVMESPKEIDSGRQIEERKLGN